MFALMYQINCVKQTIVVCKQLFIMLTSFVKYMYLCMYFFKKKTSSKTLCFIICVKLINLYFYHKKKTKQFYINR